MEPLKLNYIVKSLKNANVGIGEERKSFGCHFVCVESVYYGESNNRAFCALSYQQQQARKKPESHKTFTTSQCLVIFSLSRFSISEPG